MPSWSDDEGRCHFEVDGVPCYQSDVGCPMHRGAEPESKPHRRHTHDCDRCVFLGDFVDGGRRYDAYLCPGHPASMLPPSVLARFGSKGPQYYSLCLFPETRIALSAHPDLPLGRALLLAVEKGLVT